MGFMPECRVEWKGANMWILKGTCHYGGHPWKDGYKIGQVVFAYSTTLPKPYSTGLHLRVGSPRWPVSTEHFTFRRASALELIRLLPIIASDLKKDFLYVTGNFRSFW